jgi:hypothetical protein
MDPETGEFMAYCPGKDILILNKMFWRRDNFTMENIAYCEEAPLNCVGDREKATNMGGDVLCAEGHIGAKCLECDITARYWQESWARASALHSCGKCSEVSNNLGIIIAITIWTLFSIVISV